MFTSGFVPSFFADNTSNNASKEYQKCFDDLQQFLSSENYDLNQHSVHMNMDGINADHCNDALNDWNTQAQDALDALETMRLEEEEEKRLEEEKQRREEETRKRAQREEDERQALHISSMDPIDRILLTDEKEPHIILGVLKSKSFAEIKEQYRALSRLYHPDRRPKGIVRNNLHAVFQYIILVY